MNTLRIILNQKWTKATILLIFVQQALVATGTYMMGSLAGTFAQTMPNPWLLVALFLCVTLPGTVGHFFISYCGGRANKLTLFGYLMNYIEVNFDRPSLWRDGKSKNSRHDVTLKTGQDTILSTNHFITDVVATSLNVLLNSISVILVTDKFLGIAIFVAGSLGFFLIHLADAKIAAASNTEMESETNFNAHLAKGWDNIVLGNIESHNRWMGRFLAKFEASASAAYRTINVRDYLVSLAGFLTNAIVVGTALGLAWAYRSDTAFAVALIVMLPRSLQTTMHLQIVQGYWAQWKALRQKLELVDQSFSEPEEISLRAFVKLDKISIREAGSNGKAISMENLLFSQTGRFVIRGENGAGKSTLLLVLKDAFEEDGIYLPAHHQLETIEEGRSLSSGEAAMAHIDDLAESESKFFLLDEWDANLSAGNRKVYDAKIDALARKKLVVEIRHAN